MIASLMLACASVAIAQLSYHDAIMQGDSAAVAAGIAAGQGLETRNDAGLTPLMQAVIRNQLETTRLLIEAGADINARVEGVEAGSSVLHYAVKYASIPIVELLLAQDIALAGSLTELSYLPRQGAAARTIASLLLAAGAPLDEMMQVYDSFDNRTVLDYYPCLRDIRNARYNGGQHTCEGVAALLLGVLNTPSLENLQAPDSLRFAAMVAGPKRMQALLDSGLNPNARLVRSEGNESHAASDTTPLALALYRGNYGAARVLLDYGARLESVDPAILQQAARDPQLEPILGSIFAEAGYPLVELQHAFREANTPCSQTPQQRAMVSFVFDDGDKRDLPIIHNVFSPRQQVGTLAIVANFIGKRHYLTSEEISQLHQQGWEIASHSLEHYDQRSLSDTELSASLAQSKHILHRWQAQHFVYPFGSHDARVVAEVARHYQTAFAGGYQLNHDLSQPYSLQRHNISVRHTYDDYMRTLARAIAEEAWLIWTIHSAYDTGWHQQRNLARLLDTLCEQGVAVVTLNQGVEILRARSGGGR